MVSAGCRGKAEELLDHLQAIALRVGCVWIALERHAHASGAGWSRGWRYSDGEELV